MTDTKPAREEFWKAEYLQPAARIAFEQAEKRIADLLEIRKANEAKLTSLFGTYVAISMAIFSVAAALAQKPEWVSRAPYMFATAAPFLAGALLFGIGLNPSRGALMGMEASYWLNLQTTVESETDDSEKQMARLLAVAAHDLCYLRAPIQITSNTRRQTILRVGLALGFLGVCLFGLVVWMTFIHCGLGGTGSGICIGPGG